ncbi:hypothetical protein [Microscilla marina]|uniref:Uncharacterized protein n=1 Tax=Microscilla marina ATCC 23134 TaxID=313606 RepID=A1ZS70_MICM2|nr:hypothetical protein [Microscilla marina]EAY26793.1 hypothetical protein M23134_00759 [Microscilla marina ATCC 23134]
MIEDELKKIWQSSPQQEQVKFEKSRFMMEVQSNVDRFHKGLKWLYLREALGVIMVIPIFAVYAFIFPQILAKIASVLIILWAIYILLVIDKTKKKRPTEYTDNYLDYLHKTKAYLELHKKLRDKVLYWYVAPFISFTFLFMVGLSEGKPNRASLLVKVGVVCVIIAVIIHFLNKVSVKRFVAPKLKKVNELIKSLEE